MMIVVSDRSTRVALLIAAVLLVAADAEAYPPTHRAILLEGYTPKRYPPIRYEEATDHVTEEVS